MIVAIVNNISSALSMITSASDLAVNLDKKFGIILFADASSQIDKQKRELEDLINRLKIKVDYSSAQETQWNDIVPVCESVEASFLFIQLSKFTSRSGMKFLHACRELRIPYLFYKDSYGAMRLERVLIPVNFLIEEIEKAQFAAAFGRFCNSKITLLQANDYGSRAENNVAKIRSVLDKFQLEYQVVKGEKDSFKIEFDALKVSEKENFDLVLVSSSRDYALDDIIFGPKELHLIKKSKVPVLLINPRGDLYTLCD